MNVIAVPGFGASHIEPGVRLRDNPIRIAQTRRRMRRAQAAPTLIVIGLLGICALLYGFASMSRGASAWGEVRNFLWFLFGGVLFAGGSHQVGTRVSEDRQSGLLDFHRATPTTAWTDALGYLLGCSAREYAAAFVILPFILLATAFAGSSILAAVIGIFSLFSCSWMYHSGSMLIGLTTNRKRANQSAVVALALLFMFAGPQAFSDASAIAYLTPLPALGALDLISGSGRITPTFDFYGFQLHRVAFSFLWQGSLTAFLFWAGARKLRREGAHAFSRPGALCFFVIVTLLLVGPSWSRIQGDAVGVAAGLYFALGLVLACVLAVTLTPSYLEHTRTLRRAHRHGGRPGWLEDGASAWKLVPAFGLLLGLGLLWIGFAGEVLDASSGAFFTLETGIGLVGALACITYASSTSEYLRLRLGRASRSAAFLVTFVTLVLPLIVGSILSASSLDQGTLMYVFGMSPLFAAASSTMILAARWGGSAPVELESGQVWFSIGVTACLAIGFAVQAARARATIASSLTAPAGVPDPEQIG